MNYLKMYVKLEALNLFTSVTKLLIVCLMELIFLYVVLNWKVDLLVFLKRLRVVCPY